MAPQAYKFAITNAHEISRWTTIFRLLHSHDLHLLGINSNVQSDLSTLAFKNREQIEDFHSRILRLQQEIIFSG